MRWCRVPHSAKIYSARDGFRKLDQIGVERSARWQPPARFSFLENSRDFFLNFHFLLSITSHFQCCKYLQRCKCLQLWKYLKHYKYLQHCKYLWYCKYFSLTQFEDLFTGWLIWNVYAPKRLKSVNSASHKISHRIWWITKLGHEFVTKWSDKLGDLFVTKFLNKFFTKFFTQFSELPN